MLTAVVLGVSALLSACGGGGGVEGVVPAASVTSSATVFSADLNLAQEVPVPITPAGGIPSGSGTATLDPVTRLLSGSFTTVNLVGAGAAHIHDGDVGIAGPIVIPLQELPLGSGTWVVPANTVLTDAQIARLRAGGYYVNIHTALNPGGEIRGQLIPG
jgi:hypothetical protein